MEGIRNVFFKWKVVAIWAFFSVYQSLIFFYFVSSTNLSAKNSAGKIFGLWDVSTMAFTCVVITVNLRLLMICNSITRWHYISVGGSILAWFIFIFIYSGISTPYDRQVNSLFLLWVCCVEKENLAISLWPIKNAVNLSSVSFSAGEYLFCHICLDEYILLLCHATSSSYCCTFLWLCLPRVRFRFEELVFFVYA